MKDILKYIADGITIDKLNNGYYQVFTIPTQHFKISSLEELTPEKFEEKIKAQIELQELEHKLMNAFYEKNPFYDKDFSKLQ